MKNLWPFIFALGLWAGCEKSAEKSRSSKQSEAVPKESVLNSRPSVYLAYEVANRPEYKLSQDSIHCGPGIEVSNKLSEHCLYSFVRNGEQYRNFFSFEVNYPLWTDGADKKRWMYLPAGEQIDTRESDHWTYPVGTILWKEFSYDGIKVETRVLEKVKMGISGWRAAVYIWNQDQDEAFSSSGGGSNILGTGHVVPSVSECVNCHNGAKDFALGPEGLQLEHRNKEGINLDQLEDLGLLSHALPRPMIIMASEKGQKALGYLHGNCSHCHNPNGQWPSGVFGSANHLDLRHGSDARDLASEKAYLSLFQNRKIDIERPGNSAVIVRMESRSFRMPPVGVTKTDEKGILEMLEWIDELREEAP